MIGFDFDYFRPDTAAEAADLYAGLTAAGKHPAYYGGGTEIISMARMNNIAPGVVIDIKAIPECVELGWEGDELYIGAAVTLTRIAESGLFPLLGTTGARVADHTIQGKITLAGNLCGTIIYREASLPLLVADAKVVMVGPGGSERIESLAGRFSGGRLAPGAGELVKGFRIGRQYCEAAWHHNKQTRQDRINYPLLTTVAMAVDGGLRFAFSGLSEYPFRWTELEELVSGIPATAPAPADALDGAIEAAVGQLRTPILDDIEGSAGYRRFVLGYCVREAASALQGRG